MAKRSWVRIEISCGTEVLDELAAEVAEEFGVGVEVAEAGVRLYLDEEDLPGDWEQRLGAVLERFEGAAGAQGAPSYVQSRLEGDDWADRWKDFFKPLRIGQRFIVCPTWEQARPEQGDRVIRIDPGRAFGTGHHETTRLCLEWLEEWEETQGGLASQSLLDVGTGSGILAMAAALLECRPVVGVDIDPEAIEVATENVEINGLSEKVQLREGGAADTGGSFDIVLANIQASPLIRMAPELSRKVKDTGRLVLCGILREQVGDVRAAFEREGLRLLDTKCAGEWCLLVTGRREG